MRDTITSAALRVKDRYAISRSGTPAHAHLFPDQPHEFGGLAGAGRAVVLYDPLHRITSIRTPSAISATPHAKMIW
jgi:hypothetical protein